ncbi:MAG TPA: hypothetical protein ENI42_01515 [Thermoplasmatales archaeon]|nr:hypothetical protein [Thermoplasmatales archaeon]
MNQRSLTKNEEKVLYGLVKHPDLNESELSSLIDVKLSTLTSIKRRLHQQGLFRTTIVPMVNRLGCELMVATHTNFNPVIPLEERVKTTKKTIEIFDEIFFSVGEQEKGFSLSVAKRYTDIGKIDEIRTETFGGVGLLEKEYPQEAIFPFEISRIQRFFDYSRLLKHTFSLNEIEEKSTERKWFTTGEQYELNDKEKKILIALVENPEATTQHIGNLVGCSRHTVARTKNRFFEEKLLKKITIPDIEKLGFDILAFYHLSFNPYKPPNNTQRNHLDTFPTIFFAHRRFEAVLISVYKTYQEYKEDKTKKMSFLKENDLITYTPVIRKYVFGRMIIIKDFNFAPITKKMMRQYI